MVSVPGPDFEYAPLSRPSLFHRLNNSGCIIHQRSYFIIRDISSTRYTFVHIMPLGLVALAEALACSIEKTWKLNSWKLFLNRLNLRNYYYTQAHLLSILFLFSRQPISARNGLTYALFFDEFSTLLEPLVSAFSELLLAGDLNFHVNNPSEGKAYQFLDVLSYFNLNASNVIIPIHKSINLLDLILLPDL